AETSKSRNNSPLQGAPPVLRTRWLPSVGFRTSCYIPCCQPVFAKAPARCGTWPGGRHGGAHGGDGVAAERRRRSRRRPFGPAGRCAFPPTALSESAQGVSLGRLDQCPSRF